MVVTLLFVCFVRSDCSGLFVISRGDQLRLRSLDGLQCARNREDFRFEVTHGSSPFIWNFRAKERQGNFSGRILCSPVEIAALVAFASRRERSEIASGTQPELQ